MFDCEDGLLIEIEGDPNRRRMCASLAENNGVTQSVRQSCELMHAQARFLAPPCMPLSDMGKDCRLHLDWAMSTGIRTQSQWYPGLNVSSPPEDFLTVLARTTGGTCGTPCKASANTTRQPNHDFKWPGKCILPSGFDLGRSV